MMFEVKIQDIVSEDYCFEKVRELRWTNGVHCPACNSHNVKKDGMRTSRQCYQCRECNKKFDDLTDTVFSNSKLPLKTWILCLYFMGLNLSNVQIAKELDINVKTAHYMTEKLRGEISEKKLIYSLMERLNVMKST